MSAAQVATETEYTVYFLSPITGKWKLQHSFIHLDNAKACAENLAAKFSAMVNETVYETASRKIVSERGLLFLRAS